MFYLFTKLCNFITQKYIIAGNQTDKCVNIENNRVSRISYENKRHSTRRMLHNNTQQHTKIAIICSHIQEKKRVTKNYSWQNKIFYCARNTPWKELL